MIQALWLLLISHAVCDYPLQGDFLARGKNHKAPLPGFDWWVCLAAHCLVQAGGVYVVTGSLRLSVAEFVLHFAIDWLKCDGRTGFLTDQGLHVACKLAWAVLR